MYEGNPYLHKDLSSPPKHRSFKHDHRKEITYLIWQSFVNTIKIVNGYSFPSIFFLITFGLLWYRQAQFDTDFFIIAFVLISYLRHTYLHGFATSCTNLLQYWIAVQRIQVKISINSYQISNLYLIQTFLLSDEHPPSKMTIQSECKDQTSITVDVQHLRATWEVEATIEGDFDSQATFSVDRNRHFIYEM